MDPRIIDDEFEEQMRQIIYEGAHAREDAGGDDAGGDDFVGDDFSSQFLNNVGEGVEVQQSRDNEGPLTNSGEVY